MSVPILLTIAALCFNQGIQCNALVIECASPTMTEKLVSFCFVKYARSISPQMKKLELNP